MLLLIQKIVENTDLPSSRKLKHIHNITTTGKLDEDAFKGHIAIYKMKTITDEQKETFADKMSEMPFELNTGEIIQSWEGNLVKSVISDSDSTTNYSYLVKPNRKCLNHGETKITYSNQNYHITTWDNGNCLTAVTYKLGLTTHIKYNENGGYEKTFSPFDHLPGIFGTENTTSFMQFQEELIKQLQKLNETNKTICLHAMENYKEFAEWTEEFAKSNGYKYDQDGNHIRLP